MLELAQQAAQQIGQGGGSVREVDYANQLAMLSQRIAKNANALASADEIDPEVAFLLGKDAATFRDVPQRLPKGSDALRLAPRRSRTTRAPRSASSPSASPPTTPASTRSWRTCKELVAAKQAARGINNDAEPLLTDTTKLADAYETAAASSA